MAIEKTQTNEHASMGQIGMLVLSMYVIVALFLQTFFKLPGQVNRLFDNLDFLVCILFLFDVSYRFYKAENKLKFMKWGWIDVISSIPTINFFRWGRLVRIFRILRILRAFKSTKALISYLFKNKARGSIISAFIISMILLIFSSIAMMTCEDSADSNIKTPGDASWWGVTTITTVGYGDKYPVTAEGRIVAVILMVAGAGLFSTFTAYVASMFMEPGPDKKESDIVLLRNEIKLLHEKLDKVLVNKDRDPINS